MRIGNVTGDIYDRSVYKKLNNSRRSMLNGAASGEDCAVFAAEPGAAGLVAAQAQTVYAGPGCGRYAVFAAANQAAASGAVRIAGILLNVQLPPSAKEQTLREIVEEADSAAGQLGLALADVKASVTAAAAEAAATAVAVGWSGNNAERAAALPEGKGTAKGDGAVPGGKGATRGAEAPSAVTTQVVMTKWAGLEGSAMLACRCRDRLRERYPSYLIEEAAGFERFLSVVPEAAVAGKSGVGAMCAAAEGGIFRGLWTIAQRAGVGLEIDLKRIPIRQETVEICNHLDINPYELASNGSLLCLTEHGEALVRELEKDNIPAAVIGIATANRDRVIVNGEERRFLEPAKTDERYKVF